MPELGNDVQVRSLFNSGTIRWSVRCHRSAKFAGGSRRGPFLQRRRQRERAQCRFLGSDTKKQLFAEREALGQTIWMNGTPTW